MTTLNFALSRTASRDWQAGDEIVCTRLDHDGNVVAVARARARPEPDRAVRRRRRRVPARPRPPRGRCSRSARASSRFRGPSNAVGTVTPVAEIAALAHDAGALAWVDAVHYGPHGPIDVAAVGADVLLCSPYKFYGPHLGLAYVRRELAERWRPYKVRPAPDEPVARRFETGTLAHELLAGFVAAVEYLDDVGWDFDASEHERDARPAVPRRACPSAGGCTARRRWRAASRRSRSPTSRSRPRAAATQLGERGFAIWDGNYYAVEIMKRLGLPDGAVRVGIVHYNTADEVDRLLAALGEL